MKGWKDFVTASLQTKVVIRVYMLFFLLIYFSFNVLIANVKKSNEQIVKEFCTERYGWCITNRPLYSSGWITCPVLSIWKFTNFVPGCFRIPRITYISPFCAPARKDCTKVWKPWKECFDAWLRLLEIARGKLPYVSLCVYFCASSLLRWPQVRRGDPTVKLAKHSATFTNKTVHHIIFSYFVLNIC